MLLYHIYICFQIKRPKQLYFFVQIKKYLGIIYYYVHLHIRQCLAKQLQKYVARGAHTRTAPGTFFVYQ